MNKSESEKLRPSRRKAGSVARLVTAVPISRTYLIGRAATNWKNSESDCGSASGSVGVLPNGNKTPAIVEVTSVISRKARWRSHVHNVGRGNPSESVNGSKLAIE